MDRQQLTHTIEKLRELCIANDIQIAVAESLTAGSIGASLASVSGISDCFVGGVIAYSNALKGTLLEVSDEVLNDHSAVSQLCAEQMARGVAKLCHTRAALAVTGEAGPRSQTGKKVGTVWIAVTVDDQVVAREFIFEGSRNEIREQTTDVAITLLYETLLSPPSGKLE